MSAHDDLLQRLVLGELDPASEEAGRFFVEHPDARDELEALWGLEAEIGLAADERRDMVEQALRMQGVTGEDVVERVLAEHLAEVPVRASIRAPRWLVPLLAAAAVVLLLWRPWAAGPTVERGRETGPAMGGGVRLVHPPDEVDELDEFRWEYELGGGQYFMVKVFDPERPFDALSQSKPLEENRWKPDPEEVEGWPNPLRWELHVMLDGRSEIIAPALVHRRSP